MKEWLSKALSETGEVSTTRVVTFLALIMGFILALVGIVTGKDLNALAVLVTAFVGPALANKAISKFAENKGDDK